MTARLKKMATSASPNMAAPSRALSDEARIVMRPGDSGPMWLIEKLSKGKSAMAPAKSEYAVKAQAIVDSLAASKTPGSPWKLKATTLRLEPRLQAGLELLRGVTGVPVNKLVNEAVEKYIEQRSTDLTRDLTQVLKKLAEYKETDPQFKRALELALESERSLLHRDPAEGVPFEVEAEADEESEAVAPQGIADEPAPGSASRLVKDLLARPRH